MAGAARMHHQTRLRQLRHQFAGAAGMVQMHVGQDQPVDIRGCQSGIVQGLHQTWQGMPGAAVDEGRASVLHDQVGGVEGWPVETGIDGMYGCFASHPLRLTDRAPILTCHCKLF